MMDVYTVSFFGHRRIENPIKIEAELEKEIIRLLSEKQYVEFLVGRDGDFDLLVSSIIHRCKRTIRSDNSSHVWVLPYATTEYRNNEESFHNYYDEVDICANGKKPHFKAAHKVRNREMVDRSDLVVFFVQNNTGGAYQTLLYAQRQGKHIINLHPVGASEKHI